MSDFSFIQGLNPNAGSTLSETDPTHLPEYDVPIACNATPTRRDLVLREGVKVSYEIEVVRHGSFPLTPLPGVPLEEDSRYLKAGDHFIITETITDPFGNILMQHTER
jgi:hypothetical protein